MGSSLTRAAGFLTSQGRQSETTEEKYAVLSDDDSGDLPHTSHTDPDAEDEGLVSGRSSQSRNKSRAHTFFSSWVGLFIVGLVCLFSGGLIASIIQVYLSKESIPRGQVQVKPCGSTAAEARIRGCHFDIVSFMWLPDQCWDPELVNDFEQNNLLEWFQGPNRTGPLTREQVITGDYTPVWVNWEYHWRHCTAMWRKMHRALLTSAGKAAIDGYVAPYHHTLHCEEMFLVNRTKSFEDTDTEVRIKFPDCGMP